MDTSNTTLKVMLQLVDTRVYDGAMKLTRPEAVTLAVFVIGGADSPVDTEDVAVHVAEIAPGMFSWRKYPDFIDKEIVRVALSDARLKKHWVVGSHDKGGWLLTPTGQEWARDNEKALNEFTDLSFSDRDSRQLMRERSRLLISEAFEQVSAGAHISEISPDAADAFFRINVYVDGQARERKITRIENLFGNDPELGQTVQVLADIARSRGKE